MPEGLRAAVGEVAGALCGDGGSAGGLPAGAVLAVGVDGRTVTAARGVAQRIDGCEPVPFTSATCTDAGSVTKIIATTAVLTRLVDDADLSLDDSVEAILRLGLAEDITVRDLLEHRAGLWEWWPLYLDCAGREAALTKIGSLPRRYRHRAGRHYSDLGFMLLGGVIEEVTGLPLDRAADRLSFGPYGLIDTRFAGPVPGRPVAASSPGDRIEQTMIASGVPYPVDGSVDDFTGWRDHVLVGEVNDGNSFHAFGSCAGHAGVFTSAGDLLRFGRVILDSRNGRGPISRQTAHVFTTAGDDPGQALGWRIWQTAAGPAIGHTGFPGVGFAVLPEQDAVLAMITNRLHGNRTPPGLEELWQTALHGVVAAISTTSTPPTTTELTKDPR